MNSHPILTGLLTAAVGFTALTAATAYNMAANPPEEGTQFLRQQGFTNVKGGAIDNIQPCFNNHSFARTYTATSPVTGKTETHAVCFDMLLGPFRPMGGG